MMTIQGVARYLGVSETMIRSIDKKYLQQNFGKPRLRDLKIIAIDEISVGRRHQFLTVVINGETGAIVFVGNGKGENALKLFWKRVHSSHAKIQSVATNMSSAYYAAVLKNLPKPKHVFDRFHIISLINAKLTELRRRMHAEAERMAKPVLKGIRWLLLSWLLIKREEHLNEAKKEKARWKQALELKQPLMTGYYFKEELGQLWQQPDKITAERF
jgi:transposase